MAEDRRRPEGLPRERVWSDEEREIFRRGIMERRAGNGMSVKWSRDEKSASVSGTNTPITVLLALGLILVSAIHWYGFKDVHADHLAVQRSQEDFKCLLALPQESRIAAVKSPYGICEYLLATTR